MAKYLNKYYRPINTTKWSPYNKLQLRFNAVGRHAENMAPTADEEAFILCAGLVFRSLVYYRINNGCSSWKFLAFCCLQDTCWFDFLFRTAVGTFVILFCLFENKSTIDNGF